MEKVHSKMIIYNSTFVWETKSYNDAKNQNILVGKGANIQLHQNHHQRRKDDENPPRTHGD